jgi:hypothetical protein
MIETSSEEYEQPIEDDKHNISEREFIKQSIETQQKMRVRRILVFFLCGAVWAILIHLRVDYLDEKRVVLGPLMTGIAFFMFFGGLILCFMAYYCPLSWGWPL